ncbi:MAG: hypothetical protein J5614_01075 [Paludibacteraceae bacterium]|nr:hypothetical protein [Paludibacteraceae bacterium]
MKKETIADTPFGMAFNLQAEATAAAKFVVRHPSVVLGDDVFNAIKSSVKMTVSSAFADIYSKVVESDEWNRWYTLYDFSDTDDSIPTIFTLDDITIDGKYINLENLAKSKQNAWINLTPILGKKGLRDAYNSFLLKDTPEFAALITRGLLCMSYNDSTDQWLNATSSETILDAYVYIVMSYVRSLYNLDTEQEKLLKTFFAVYYAQRLQANNDPLDIPPILNRCKWLGTPREISERLEPTFEFRRKTAKELKLHDADYLSFDLTCKLCAEFGPDRMKNFGSASLVSYMSRGAMRRNASIMSLYYPPYFVFMLLCALHGLKHPIFANLLKFPDQKKKIFEFSKDLTKHDMLFDSLKR